MYSKFAELLKKNGKLPSQVANDTGIDPSCFSDWKSGKSKPKVDKLKKLADYFGVTIEYFLEDESVGV